MITNQIYDTLWAALVQAHINGVPANDVPLSTDNRLAAAKWLDEQKKRSTVARILNEVIESAPEGLLGEVNAQLLRDHIKNL